MIKSIKKLKDSLRKSKEVPKPIVVAKVEPKVELKVEPRVESKNIERNFTAQKVKNVVAVQDATVAVATKLPSHISYNLVDSSENLAEADTSVAKSAIDISATDAATIQQARVIANFGNSGKKNYRLADTSANLLSESTSNPSLVSEAVSVEVSAHEAFSVEGLKQLHQVIPTITFPQGYNLADSAANLIADSQLGKASLSYGRIWKNEAAKTPQAAETVTE